MSMLLARSSAYNTTAPHETRSQEVCTLILCLVSLSLLPGPTQKALTVAISASRSCFSISASCSWQLLNPSGKHAQNLYQTGHPVIGSGFKFHLKYVKLYNVNFLAVNLPSPPNCCEVHVQRPVRAFLHGDVLAKPAVLQPIPTGNSLLGANEAVTQRIFLKHHNMI